MSGDRLDEHGYGRVESSESVAWRGVSVTRTTIGDVEGEVILEVMTMTMTMTMTKKNHAMMTTTETTTAMSRNVTVTTNPEQKTVKTTQLRLLGKMQESAF